MAQVRLFLPLGPPATPAGAFAIVAGYHDALPDGSHRRLTRIQVDGIAAAPDRARPLAVWRGTLEFQPSVPIADAANPLDPAFEVSGDFVLRFQVADMLRLRKQFPHSPPNILIYRNLNVTGGYLSGDFLTMLRATLVVRDETGQRITGTPDQLRAFLRGELPLSALPSDSSPVILPALTPVAADSAELELICGTIEDEEVRRRAVEADPLAQPGFSPFPIEHFFQLLADRAPAAFASGHGGHGLLAVFRAAPTSSTVTVIEEFYKPDEGITVEECFPDGTADPVWLDLRYNWTGADGLSRTAPLPPTGRFFSGDTPAYTLEQTTPAGWAPVERPFARHRGSNPRSVPRSAGVADAPGGAGRNLARPVPGSSLPEGHDPAMGDRPPGTTQPEQPDPHEHLSAVLGPASGGPLVALGPTGLQERRLSDERSPKI